MTRRIDTLDGLYGRQVIVDVRSPGEFVQGHIPGAHNIALFTDAERAEVGTAYTQISRDEAIQRGLRYVAPKLDRFVAEACSLVYDTGRGKLSEVIDQPMIVYCWRGGMRSDSMAWLFESAGLRAEIIDGGYKMYRQHVLSALEHPWNLRVIGGRTGSGKTKVLKALREAGAQVIDLEGLARHKGSAFGALGQPPQPSSEHMANLMHRELMSFDPEQVIYVEDESLRIGTVALHRPFFDRMRSSPIIVLEVPRDERAQFLARDYGEASMEELAECFQRIERRLGGLRLQQALHALQGGDLIAAGNAALDYYDGTYDYGLSRRDPSQITRLDGAGASPEELAQAILQNRE